MPRETPRTAVGGYLRRYPFAPRYRPEQRLVLTTADGVRLAAFRLPGPPDAVATVVLVHGFSNWSRTPGIHAFAHLLARRVHVIVPDLRGHGRSGGLCSLGRHEPLDVAAAVDAARPDLPVVTVGTSFGGAAVLLHAGTYGGVAGVVAVSSLAYWGDLGTEGSNRVQRFIGSRSGRMLLACLMRTRISDDCAHIADAARVMGAIAPAFTIVVHDPGDWYFGPDHAERLYRLAEQPKDLWWYPGGGHGTDLLTTAFADRLLGEVEGRLGREG
jgi:pimeloyl-ACP methyl ester carboxylesterase